MQYDEGAQLDLSDIQDRRGFGGGRGVAVGGGGLGVVGVVVYLLINVLGGNSGHAATDVLGGLQSGQSANSTQLSAECRTGADANTKRDCAVAADIDSIESFWSAELSGHGTGYRPARTVFFSGATSSGCGTASSGTGPFYCPADEQIYIDLSFYDDLQTRFGAHGGLFVDAYVIAHEYGHHVQNLLGTSTRLKPGLTGPSSGAVRLELQADCFAGVWAEHATTTPGASGRPLITSITSDDVNRALDAASRIGDDYIQTNLGNGTNDPSSYSHGTSEQRRRWFSTGYRSGSRSSCDTFSISAKAL
jgi:predicted metalloprotease